VLLLGIKGKQQTVLLLVGLSTASQSGLRLLHVFLQEFHGEGRHVEIDAIQMPNDIIFKLVLGDMFDLCVLFESLFGCHLEDLFIPLHALLRPEDVHILVACKDRSRLLGERNDGLGVWLLESDC
jgi:hypothetical protein